MLSTAFWEVEFANRHVKWSLRDRRWVDVPKCMEVPDVCAFALKREYFGEGAERLVRKFRLVSVSNYGGASFAGPLLVAKESRFVEDLATDGQEFHRVFCDAQARAQHLAEAFNAKLATIPGAR